jgi:hypothetical protein
MRRRPFLGTLALASKAAGACDARGSDPMLALQQNTRPRPQAAAGAPARYFDVEADWALAAMSGLA